MSDARGVYAQIPRAGQSDNKRKFEESEGEASDPGEPKLRYITDPFIRRERKRLKTDDVVKHFLQPSSESVREASDSYSDGND